MSKLLTILLLSVLTTGAYAHEDEHEGGDPSQGGSPTATAVASGGDSSARSNAKSTSASSSRSVATSGSESSADSSNTNTANGGSATNAGNSQSTSTSYTAQKNPVNTAIAGVGETTAACRYHNGGGLQLLGVGISVGHSSKDADCERLALATFLYAHGKDLAGDRVMCNITAVKEALGEDCLALVNELKAAPPAADGSTKYVTPAELDNAMRKAATK